jgi:predicted nucleic acid-binding protein
MYWWNQAIFDTCSVITLDKIREIDPEIGNCFPKTIRVIEATFAIDQLRDDTVERMRRVVTVCDIPSSEDLSAIYKKHSLSKSLSDVDKLLFATAVHHGLAVVTADRQLGKAIEAQSLEVTDMATVLRELVTKKRISKSACETLLVELANRRDLILGTTKPSWNKLRSHRFPNR